MLFLWELPLGKVILGSNGTLGLGSVELNKSFDCYVCLFDID